MREWEHTQEHNSMSEYMAKVNKNKKHGKSDRTGNRPAIRTKTGGVTPRARRDDRPGRGHSCNPFVIGRRIAGNKIKTSSLRLFEREMLTCTACGFCKSVCPTFRESGWEAISPRARVLLSYGLLNDNLPADESVVEALSKCTTCADCYRRCPSKVKIVDIIECARKEIYDSGFAPDAYRRIAANIQSTGNPYGVEGTVPDAIGEIPRPSEVGFFVGCTTAYRSPDTGRIKLSLLQRIHPETTLVDTICCGSPLKRTGSGGVLFEKHVKENIARTRKLGIKKLIISCAGCYKTIKHDYPKSEMVGIDVVHMIDYLNLNSAKLSFKPLNAVVAYHDPCHLGRGTETYDAPRELLKKIPGLNLVELAHNRKESLCCGGGGGLRATYPDMAQKIAERRVKEAKYSGAEILVTSCPFCVNNLRKGEETAKTGIKIMDIAELIYNQVV